MRSELKAARKNAVEEEKERRRVAALSDEAKTVYGSKQFVETFGNATASRTESAIEDAMRSGDSRRINAAKLLSKDIRDGFEVESITASGSKYLTGTGKVQFSPDSAKSPRAIAHELAHGRDHLSVLPGGTSPTSTGGWSIMSFGKDGTTLAERFKVEESGITPAWRDLKERLGVKSDGEVVAKILQSNPDIVDHPADFEGFPT